MMNILGVFNQKPTWLDTQMLTSIFYLYMSHQWIGGNLLERHLDVNIISFPFFFIVMEMSSQNSRTYSSLAFQLNQAETDRDLNLAPNKLGCFFTICFIFVISHMLLPIIICSE